MCKSIKIQSIAQNQRNVSINFILNYILVSHKELEILRKHSYTCTETHSM